MATARLKRPKKAAKLTAKRIDAVFIRKSGKQQEDAAQIANVKTMLQARGITIPDEHWFVTTVGRRWVSRNEVFQRLIKLVEEDRIGTVYIEDQKRWGTRSSQELFKYLGTFRQHKSELFDLRNNRNLAAKDVYSEIMAVLKSHESQAELKDLAFRPLRSKVNNFKDRASWPTGTHPFGFGKRNYAADGKTRLWEWHPISRTIGQHFYYEGKKRRPGPKDVRIQRKDKGTITKLIPNDNKEYVKSVATIFDLFVTQGLSFRQIAIQLNNSGRLYYRKPFTHALVSEILRNPAYVGDTHFGKVQSGELCSFNPDGTMAEMLDTDSDDVLPVTKRPVTDRLIRQNTHEGLIDRKTWNAAQAKLHAAGERPNFAARKAEYYLKPLLICGHCGKNMTGSTEVDRKTGKPFTVYFCSTYKAGRSTGQAATCGAYRIRHSDAEQLLLNKAKAMNLEINNLISTSGKDVVEDSMDLTDMDYSRNSDTQAKLVAEGIKALRQYYKSEYQPAPSALKRFEQAAEMLYDVMAFQNKELVTEFRHLVKEAEAKAVSHAEAKLKRLRKDHAKLTRAWVMDQASDLQKSILKQECDRIEAEIAVWAERTKPLSARLKEARAEGHEIAEKYWRLLKEWPALEMRERGEALRRVFKSVRLYWDKKFAPALENPSRPRTTKRPGRHQFTLATDRIVWDFVSPGLAGCS